jgi:hypothetical protein
MDVVSVVGIAKNAKGTQRTQRFQKKNQRSGEFLAISTFLITHKPQPIGEMDLYLHLTAHRAARGRRALAKCNPIASGLAAGAARPMPRGKPTPDEG